MLESAADFECTNILRKITRGGGRKGEESWELCRTRERITALILVLTHPSGLLAVEVDVRTCCRKTSRVKLSVDLLSVLD